MADAYRDRFVLARRQLDRLEEIVEELRTALRVDSEQAWLIAAVTPNSPGRMSLTRSGVRTQGSLVRELDGVPTMRQSVLRYYADARAFSGHRRAILRFGNFQNDQSGEAVAHLHEDGSTSIAVRVGERRPNRAGQDRDLEAPMVDVDDEQLTQEVLYVLAIAVHHATRNAVTGGDAVVEALVTTQTPMRLSHGRGDFSFGGHWEQDVSIKETGRSRHTISLDAIAASPVELLVAGRLVVTDLLQSFGLAESPQITSEGAVRHKYWSAPDDRIRSHCESLGVAVTSDVLA